MAGTSLGQNDLGYFRRDRRLEQIRFVFGASLLLLVGVYIILLSLLWR